MSIAGRTSNPCGYWSCLIVIAVGGPGAMAAGPVIGPAWQSLGPSPIGDEQMTGRVPAIVCSPTNANKYFAAGADGGVWRTTDGGASWNSLTDFMPTTAMGALALDPANENVIYAGTGEANFAYHSRHGVGIYKSTDGGDNWTQLGASTFSGRCISRIIVSPANSLAVYASVTQAGGFIPPKGAAKGAPGVDGPLGVFLSSDGGVNWSQLGGVLPTTLSATDLAMRGDNSQILFAAIGHHFGNAANGIYRTIDGGTTWTKLAGGLPTVNVGRISLAIAPSNPARIYAAIAHSADSQGGSAGVLGLFRSDNGGDNWTALTSPGAYMSTYGWYGNSIGVSPSDANTVYVGGVDMYRSSNSGSSWTIVSPPHPDCHAIVFDSSGRLVVGDDGGVQRSTNLGGSWTLINTGLGTIQFYAGISLDPSNTQVIYGGIQDNNTGKRTGPSNSDWISLIGGDGGFTAVDRNNPLVVFGEFQGSGSLYKSTNGGASFSSSSSGINTGDRNCFEAPFEIDPSNSSRMYYGTHRAYRSTNGGTGWTAVSPDLTATSTGAIHSLAIAPSNGQVVYVTTSDGNVQVTMNDGTSWQLVRTGLPGWFRTMRQVTVEPQNHLAAYLAGSRYATSKVLRTLDGGTNWAVLDGDLPDQPVNVVAVDVRAATHILYAGMEAGVYRSVNGGATWHRFGQALPNVPVVDLRLDTANARLVAATQGRGAWQMTIWLPGDVNNDGVVNLVDLPLFVDVLLGNNVDSGSILRSDVNADGSIDGLDVQAFIAALGV